CTLHGAPAPFSSAVMLPRLVSNTTVRVAVGVGEGAGGRPTSNRLGFPLSASADSADPPRPLGFLAARLAILAGLRAGSGERVELGLALGLVLDVLVGEVLLLADGFLSSLVNAMTTTATTTASTTVPAIVAIRVQRLRVASRSWRRRSCRSRWRRAASRRCLSGGTKRSLP